MITRNIGNLWKRRIKIKHLIIDGDAIAYRSACAVQHKVWVTEDPGMSGPVEWPKGTVGKTIPELPGRKIYRVETVEPVENALQICKTYFSSIFSAVRDKFEEEFDVSVFLTSQDKSDPRYQIAKTKGYKANRTSEKPLYLEDVRGYIMKRSGGIVISGMEADDAISITAHTYAPDEVVIAGVDKDLYQIRGHHYDIAKRTWKEVGCQEAAVNFYMQMLTGDTSDNVPGIKGLGKAKATKALDTQFASLDNPPTISEYHAAVKHIYRENGHDDAYFLEQGQLLYLRQSMGDLWDGNVFGSISQDKQFTRFIERLKHNTALSYLRSKNEKEEN